MVLPPVPQSHVSFWQPCWSEAVEEPSSMGWKGRRLEEQCRTPGGEPQSSLWTHPMFWVPPTPPREEQQCGPALPIFAAQAELLKCSLGDTRNQNDSPLWLACLHYSAFKKVKELFQGSALSRVLVWKGFRREI